MTTPLNPLTCITAEVLAYRGRTGNGPVTYTPVLYVDGVLTRIAKAKTGLSPHQAQLAADRAAKRLRKTADKAPLLPEATQARALAYLNSVWRADPEAIRNLMGLQVPCNEALDAHPYCVVGQSGVGPLGLINGLLEVLGIAQLGRVSPPPAVDNLDGLTMFVPRY